MAIQRTKTRAGPLDIRTRAVFRGNGETGPEIQELVRCPFQSKSVHIEECMRCGHQEGLVLTGDRKRTALVCGRSLDDLPASVLERRCHPSAWASISVVMKAPVCVRPELGVDALATIFDERGLRGAPVVDENAKLKGVVSATDLNRHRGEWETSEPLKVRRGRPGRRGEERLGRGFHVERGSRLTVSEIMTPLVVTLPESALVWDAAALMAEKGVHLVPVLAGDGEVVGIVSALDVLGWLARCSRPVSL